MRSTSRQPHRTPSCGMRCAVARIESGGRVEPRRSGGPTGTTGLSAVPSALKIIAMVVAAELTSLRSRAAEVFADQFDAAAGGCQRAF